MKKKLILFFTIIIISLNIQGVLAQEDIILESEAAVLMEETTGKIIYEKNPNQKMFPASTTKILTGLIALENADLKDEITVGGEINQVPYDASRAGHKVGDVLTLEELLHALLLPSGNDSAYVISNYIAKKTTGSENISYEEATNIFASLMNERAKEIGANNSNFVNPHGYHDENHYTTAMDLALITQEAIKNTTLKGIMGKAEFSITDRKTEKTTIWRNSNLLINSSNQKYYYPYAISGKTGFTDQAGECLVSTASKDGLDLISVVLKSLNGVRFEESKELFEYGFNNYTIYKFILAGDLIETINVDKHSPKGPSGLDVISAKDFTDLIKIDDIEKVEKIVEWNDILVKAPVQAGEQLGKVKFVLNGNTLTEINIVAKTNIEKITILEFLISFEAIPYWSGIIGTTVILFTIIKFIKNRKSRRGFRIRR